MRGRLIFPFGVGLRRLDVVTTAADPDGAGPLLAGYDADFREPVSTAPASPGPGPHRRVELAEIVVPAQVEPEMYEKLNQMMAGNSPRGMLGLIFHFRDLEDRSLVDSVTGEPLIRVNDRFSAIYEKDETTLIQTIRNPPGLFAVEVQPRGFGLGRNRNLLLVKFEARMVAA